jgi:sirohydrochlorin ferrochelatase
MKTALLLIAHGSRREEANADARVLAQMLAARGSWLVAVPVFLELAQPDITTGAKQCVAAGAERVILLPFFLSAGTHVVEDLEAHRRSLGEQHPHVEFLLAQPLGCHPLLVEILVQRALEALPSA